MPGLLRQFPPNSLALRNRDANDHSRVMSAVVLLFYVVFRALCTLSLCGFVFHSVFFPKPRLDNSC